MNNENFDPAFIKDVVEKKTLDSAEAAKYLGISYWLIRKLVRENKIPHYQIQSKTLFTKEILDKYIEDSLHAERKSRKITWDNF